MKSSSFQLKPERISNCIKKNIFIKNINNKYKLILFNTRNKPTGNIKYYPADSKEWKNKIYFFNVNNIKNFAIFDKNIYKLIKSYFNLYIRNRVLLDKYISRRKKRLTLKKIFISTPEIKHSNSKIKITVFIFNVENLYFIKKIKKMFSIFFNRRFKLKRYLFYQFLNKKKNLHSILKNKYLVAFINKIFFVFRKFNTKNLYKTNDILNYIKYSFYKKNDFLKKILKFVFHKELIFFRKHKLNLNIHKNKFEPILLNNLSYLISKFYSKKIEFNIVNLESITFHPDLFTEYLRLKLKRRKVVVLRALNFIMARIKLPELNWAKEKNRITNINFDKLDNVYNNLNLNFIVNENLSFNQLLNKFYKNTLFYQDSLLENNILKLKVKNIKKNIILKSIKYKTIRGIKLEANGRLTWRYRADRTVRKLRRKGGLKDFDSAFKGLSNVTFRGYMNSNVEYSIRTSKRRVGSFAVKGWIGAK